MARTRTLAELKTDVSDRADIVIDDAGKHTNTRIVRYINQAVQAFVRMTARAGHEHYLRRSTISTATSTTEDANGWAPCEYIAQPSDMLAVRAMEITVSGAPVPMIDVETLEGLALRNAQVWSAETFGAPRYYRVGGLAKPGGTNTDAIRIFPKADAVYSIECWYLARPTDMSGDSDTFDGVAGMEEWVVNRAAMDCLLRAGLPTSDQYQALAAENARLEAEVKFTMATRGGPGRRIWTAGLRASAAGSLVR